jgi:hypothetical protein
MRIPAQLWRLLCSPVRSSAARIETAERERDQAIIERDQALRDRAALALTLAFSPMSGLDRDAPTDI